jgi:hypothetical protein
MDAVSSKSKRTMRVATVFTGIAACTAGMAAYGTTAQAATHTTVKPTVKPAVRPAVRTPGRVSGSIREVTSCGSNTWLHVMSEDNFGSFCFGFRGTSIPTNETGMYAQCGGNNYGWLSSLRGSRFVTFGKGTTYRTLNWPHLSYVHISGWTGTDKCYPVF